MNEYYTYQYISAMGTPDYLGDCNIRIPSGQAKWIDEAVNGLMEQLHSGRVPLEADYVSVALVIETGST